MRRLTLGLPLAMGAVCGAYTIIYLARWEWNRAIIAGLFFVAVEIIFVALAVSDRFRRLEARLDAMAANGAEPPATADAAPTPRPVAGSPLDAIRAAAPEPHDHFGWIRDQRSGTNVFLPVLLGAGVLASGLAWVVEHVARSAVWPVRERHLLERLATLRPPPGGLLGPSALRPARVGPARRAVRWAATIGAVVLVVVGTVGLFDFVADHTQTRPDQRATDVDTLIELELLGAVAARDPERVVGHLWSVCTGPDVFRALALPAAEIRHARSGRIHIRVPTDVGEHGMERLRGCLNDATLDKVQARVVSATTSRRF